MKTLAQTNHLKERQDKTRQDLLKRLKGLGFNYEAHSFGITVLIGGKIMYHGVESEITKWLEELEK